MDNVKTIDQLVAESKRRHIELMVHGLLNMDLEPIGYVRCSGDSSDTINQVLKEWTEKKVGIQWVANGAVILEKKENIVLAYQPGGVEPFITWETPSVSSSSETPYFWGHYFRDMDSAMADYNKRVINS